MAAVNAERVGNRIHLSTPFKYKDRCKSVIGARWSKQARCWTYPLDLEVARLLREEFPQMVLGPELTAWGREQVTQEGDLGALNNLQDIDVMEVIDLPRVREQAPTMWAAMMNRPYQPVASKFMATARQCLNGDQPGVGKTIETLGALIEAGVTGPVLVLAPRTSCKVVWEPEIRQWYADEVPYTITQTAGLSPSARAVAYDSFNDNRLDNPDMIHFLIANAEQVGIKKFTECPAGTCDGDEDWCPYMDEHVNKSETRRPFLHAIKWEAIIADETHKWLINTRGKAASQVGYGFTKLVTSAVESPRWALSGTPLKGKKHNLFGTLNWLRSKVYTSKWRWLDQYFEVKKEEKDIGRRGSVTVRHIGDIRPERHDAFFRSLNTIMIRRTKSELRAINPAWMPPEKQYHDVWVEMDPAQKRHYAAMEKSTEVSLNGGVLSATGVLALMTRLRQFANSDGDINEHREFVPTMPSAKFDWLLQFLDERGIEVGVRGAPGDVSEEVHKVVVASQFTSQINAWADALEEKGIKRYVLTGETSDKMREQIVGNFKERDDVRVMFINTMLGGVSITLDAADDMVIMDETWVPDDQEQVEDRIHRASNVDHQVDIWYVRTKNTIEEALAEMNGTKALNNHYVLDAQRGLRFASERFGVSIKKGKAKA